MATQATLDRVFAAIEYAAVNGERCPSNFTMAIKSDAICALAYHGRILFEIFSPNNYRVATILSGPNAGAKTVSRPKSKRHPTDNEPIKTIGSDVHLHEKQKPAARPPGTDLDVRAYDPRAEDEAFQAAMIAAGYTQQKASSPGTDYPQPIATTRGSFGSSSMDF